MMIKDESMREKMFSSIALWQASDLSQKEWCRQQNITYHIFHYWYRKYRQQQPETRSNASFVQLTVKQDIANSCEVVFSDGTRIVFSQPVSAQYLKSLLF